jgi:hypothetical protein
VITPVVVIHHMPDGKPAPTVMTPEQVCEFLQLPAIASHTPQRRLHDLCRRGLVSRDGIGKGARYLLSDVVAFVASLSPARPSRIAQSPGAIRAKARARRKAAKKARSGGVVKWSSGQVKDSPA